MAIKISSLEHLHLTNKVTHLMKGFPRYRRIRKRTKLQVVSFKMRLISLFVSAPGKEGTESA